MNKLLLMDIFMQARLRAARREQLICHQRSVLSNLDGDAIDIDMAESKKMLAALADARDRDLGEMNWALDQLDKTAAPPAG